MPQLFCVKWFRNDESGRFVWPGFGENARVLKWMLQRIEGQAKGVEHVFGVTPSYDDIDWTGLAFTQDQYLKIASIDATAWKDEFALHAELFDKLNHGLPPALAQTKVTLEARLQERLAA